MAGRGGRDVRVLGCKAQRLRFWGRAKKICRPCRLTLRRGHPPGIRHELFHFKAEFIQTGRHPPGKAARKVVLARSLNGPAEAETTYRPLVNDYPALEKEAANYYAGYLDGTVRVELPDRSLQQAYDWARVSVLHGLVNNPLLGTGLIAGYRTSGGSQRPGFAWFFGRDALWTALALDAAGDFATTRTALDFLSKYQRADGKVPHEISQGAPFVPWFNNFPYAYASADATPLYIITMNDY